MLIKIRSFLHPEPRIKRLSQLQSEALFLAGRHSRLHEFSRVFRIAIEFIRGFRGLHHIGPAVTIFGSARFQENHPYYTLARDIGAALAREGFTVMTGGGPGIMEAANRGAKDVGGRSLGCNIVLPHEQRPNPFVDSVITFYYFFVRKVMLVKYSYAFIILPGGFGTLDELTEALTLIQTGKLYDFPIILVGSEYWRGFMEWVQGTLVANGTISADDLHYLKVTDDAAQVARMVKTTAEGIGLTLTPLPATLD